MEDQKATTLDVQNAISQSESQQKRLMCEIQVLEQKVCKCFVSEATWKHEKNEW